jgi:type VI protein secretion system component Hcp
MTPPRDNQGNAMTDLTSKTLATDSTDNAVTDSELDLVTGGITVSKRTDVSSTDLLLKCANGKHY